MATDAAGTSAAEQHAINSKHADESPASEPRGDQFGGPLGAAFGASPDSDAKIVANGALSLSVNTRVRGVALRHVQQRYGNQFVQRALNRKINTAETTQRECACGGSCAKCQARSINSDQYILSDTAGESLDRRTRGTMESYFGSDFSDVRIHRDSQAAASAEALNANAYTIGRDVYFASGRYAPETTEGKRLLAHELVHTLQQGSNSPSLARQAAGSPKLIIDPDASQEHDAERAAEELISSPGGEELSVPSRTVRLGSPSQSSLASSSTVTVSRDADDTQEQPPPQPTDDVASVYETVLHLWNLRSGMGEALNEEEDKILANEDITARLVENACAPQALTMEPRQGVTSPGLTDESLLFSPGEDEGYELSPVSDDEIQLAKAFAYRMVLLLRTLGPDDFADEEDFWTTHKDLTKNACSEEETLYLLGDEVLKESWAFPRAWAKRLQKGFIPDLNLTALQDFRNKSYSELNEAAQAIPPYLAANGLPINFRDSLSLGFLRPAELVSILRTNSATANLLSDFFSAEEAALEDDQKLSFGRRWLQLGNEIVAAVGAAHKSVNAESYDSYWRKISVETLMSDRSSTGEFEADHLHLTRLEMDISNMSYVWSFVRKWMQKQRVDGVLDRQFELADALIRALDSEPRLGRAQQWRSAKEFDSAAKDFLIESIDVVDVAVGVGKDFLINLGIAAIFGPLGVLVKEIGEAAYSVNESREKISAALDAARIAKSVTQLQNASANLALVMAAEGMSIALTIAQVPGMLKAARNLPGASAKGPHIHDDSALKKTTTDEPAVSATKSDQPSVKQTPPEASGGTKAPDTTTPPTKQPSAGTKVAALESETDFLARTRDMPSDKIRPIDAQKEFELAWKRGQRRPPQEPYAHEIEFNNHTWRYNKNTGNWCRFGSPKNCFDLGEQARKQAIDEYVRAKGITTEKIETPDPKVTAQPKSKETLPEGYEDMPSPSITKRVDLAEDHHIATRYRAANREIFERAGLHIDDDLNLIKNFQEHGQLRGWYKWEDRSYKFNYRGHHPDYNKWVTKLLSDATPPGLSPDEALKRIVKITERLNTIIRENPEALSHGPRILPNNLQNPKFEWDR